MKVNPGPPPDEFRSSIAATYDNVAQHREEQGEYEWRWPIAERVLATLREEGRTTLLEVGAGVGYTARWFADHDLEGRRAEQSSGRGVPSLRCEEVVAGGRQAGRVGDGGAGGAQCGFLQEVAAIHTLHTDTSIDRRGRGVVAPHGEALK